MTTEVPGAPATAADIAAAVASHKVSAAAVVKAALGRIGMRNPAFNAFVTMTAERALARAWEIDNEIARGMTPGPLAGVPFAVKNLYDVAGLPTLAGSRINASARPASADAVVVRRLEEAGAILVGTTGMGEYAYDFTGKNSHYGPTRNPHDTERITGGSSGGSAAAVAGGLVPLALGSDTNGSIRVPASLCGVFGLKPTFGRLPRRGTFPFVASLDHVGPFARTVRDLALTYDAMQGFDADDPACVDRAVEPATPSLTRGLGGLRLAVASGDFVVGGAAESGEALARAAAVLGITLRVEIPEAARARAAASVITAAEGGALHFERLRARAAEFDPNTRDRFFAGALTPAAWVNRAQRFRQRYRRQIAKLFESVDIILAPTTPISAPRLDQASVLSAGIEVPVGRVLGLYAQPLSFIGLPVASVPIAGFDMPIGVQVIGRPWEEASVIAVAAQLERRGVAAAPVAGSGTTFWSQ